MASQTAVTSLFDELFGGDWPPAGAARSTAGRPATVERRGCRARSAHQSGRVSGVVPGGECTLDDVIVGAWEALTARLPTSCPMCDGQMAAVAAATGSGVEGCCRDCGTVLA